MFSVFLHKFIHLVALAILTGYTFHAFAAPAETRKQTLMITGIAALLMLVSGMALMTKIGYEWKVNAWVWIKLICWLGLAAVSAIAYRRRTLVPKLKLATLALIAVALYMVVYKPAIF